jgi:hypothetical protein
MNITDELFETTISHNRWLAFIPPQRKRSSEASRKTNELCSFHAAHSSA